jgi:hypothetical protein
MPFTALWHCTPTPRQQESSNNDGLEFARLNPLIFFSNLPALTSRSTLLINCG